MHVPMRSLSPLPVLCSSCCSTCRRSSQLAAEALVLRKSIERYMKLTYAAKKDLRERQQLLGGTVRRSSEHRVLASVCE